MKDILQKVLTDASVRNTDAIEVAASSQDEFLSWT